MTTFTQGQHVAIVEHDPDTRQPLKGGRVEYGTVVLIGGLYVQIKTGDRKRAFYQESGWEAWTGDFGWRLIPICARHDEPILGESYVDPDDPAGRVYCDRDCFASANEAKAERAYENNFGG